jgi:diaminohydroxyphosphoribosylaminopyrimidine deaminase/5-amino-6-(5-phosphoribosylamino)uracil reductase
MSLTTDQKYMQRCLELARRGAGYVVPNPMVGAVLVCNDVIIGEGWHEQYGQAHAEVNAIDLAILTGQFRSGQADCTLYVSLEPCAHTGKTPPCADLIIRHKIPKVVIGCRDPFAAVNGKGIEKLLAAGVEVVEGVLEDECRELNKRFFTVHEKKRPYVVLKWAQTGDGFIAPLNPPPGGTYKDPGFERLLISNEYSNRLVHQWRSEEAAILVGTNTALVDNPALTTRLWPGPSPVRLVLDMNLRLPSSLRVFNGEVKTIVFNSIRQEEKGNLVYYKIVNDEPVIPQILDALYRLHIQSVMVEGGATLLQSFIDDGLWDEARIITNTGLIIGNGIAAPVFTTITVLEEKSIDNDRIQIWVNAPHKKSNT